MYLLETIQHVAEERDKVFEFFARPENLAQLTPGWLDFRILTPSPIPMDRGTVIDYRIGLGGVPMRWRTLIADYEPPCIFIDEQLDGPYAVWHHTHRFETVPGGTRLVDRVRYLPPLGILGRLAHGLLIRRQLTRIFSYRQEVIAARFGGRVDEPSSLSITRLDAENIDGRLAPERLENGQT